MGTFSSGARTRAKGRIESGDGRAGISPMDGLLTAVAACTAVDDVDIRAKMRKTLTAYVQCQGWRHDEHPRACTKVRFVHRMTGPDLEQASAERAVHFTRKAPS